MAPMADRFGNLFYPGYTPEQWQRLAEEVGLAVGASANLSGVPNAVRVQLGVFPGDHIELNLSIYNVRFMEKMEFGCEIGVDLLNPRAPLDSIWRLIAFPLGHLIGKMQSAYIGMSDN